MKIQLLSDLHIEFRDYPYPHTDADVVVLAGDIHTKYRGFEWACDQIQNTPVIYVLGNHEYYGKAYPKLVHSLKQQAQGSNVHILEKDMITIDGINFLGCTLWTDFELFGDPRIAGAHCQSVMNDYKKIRRLPGYSKLRSVDVAAIHRQSLAWLKNSLSVLDGQTNIVVTHHAPSLKSIAKCKHNDLATAAYASNLDAIIEEYKPLYWLHGHLHHNLDYTIGNCRVLCNPKGYAGDENIGYDPYFCFEA